MEGDDVEYVEASAGASATYPVQCSSLRKNGFVMIKGRPCKIMEMSTSKTGKHGHAKVKVLIYFSSFLSPSLPLTHTHTYPLSSSSVSLSAKATHFHFVKNSFKPSFFTFSLNLKITFFKD